LLISGKEAVPKAGLPATRFAGTASMFQLSFVSGNRGCCIREIAISPI